MTQEGLFSSGDLYSIHHIFLVVPQGRRHLELKQTLNILSYTTNRRRVIRHHVTIHRPNCQFEIRIDLVILQ